MVRIEKRLWLCAVLLILNLLFIWGNSLLPGELSGALSQWIKDLLGIGGKDPDAGHGLLRKFAHFMEFACLGILLKWLLAMLQKPAWLALACGGVAACADETIQCFVPDRGPAVTDVLLNTAGVFVGMVILLTICKLYKKSKHKENIT